MENRMKLDLQAAKTLIVKMLPDLYPTLPPLGPEHCQSWAEVAVGHERETVVTALRRMRQAWASQVPAPAWLASTLRDMTSDQRIEATRKPMRYDGWSFTHRPVAHHAAECHRFGEGENARRQAMQHIHASTDPLAIVQHNGQHYRLVNGDLSLMWDMDEPESKTQSRVEQDRRECVAMLADCTPDKRRSALDRVCVRYGYRRPDSNDPADWPAFLSIRAAMVVDGEVQMGEGSLGLSKRLNAKLTGAGGPV